MSSLTTFFASRRGIAAVGALIGILAPLLQHLGNPPNMGVCVACFERDIAGGLGLHRATAVQYLRPEIPGFVLGAMIAALVYGEFRARGGSAPIVRFVLGMLAMIGGLAFLGCPWRALLRLAGGDLNAIVGLAGLALGVFIGVQFLKAGYSLGRSRAAATPAGLVLPLVMVGILLLAWVRPVLGEGLAPFASESGPGSMRAPLLVSLLVGLGIGFVAQRSRFCTMGALRDVVLMGDTHLMSGVAALLVAAIGSNVVLGQVRVGIAAQPVAHSNHLWNLAGMTLSGLAFALAGGCPGRQLFMAGEGDGDAALFVLGMIAGAAVAHNLGLAGQPDALVDGTLRVGGISPAGMVAVLLGLALCLALGWTMRERAMKEVR